MALRIDSPNALLDESGRVLPSTSWRQIDQGRIDAFAAATDDHQWIHVDQSRALAGPFGATIAHGFLTLSLLSAALDELLIIDRADMVVNYGLDRVRFLRSVPVDSRVRFAGELTSAQRTGAGVRTLLRVKAEIDGEPQPAMVADWIVLVRDRASED